MMLGLELLERIVAELVGVGGLVCSGEEKRQTVALPVSALACRWLGRASLVRREARR
jgi:hypothetical protein